ncbi:MAG: hypothetical protein QXD49_08290 [Archaeoglobaceae archaeon]
MIYVNFKPKPKIRFPESKKEQISITIKKKSKSVWKKKQKPSCLDCIDGKLIKSDEGFRGKTNVYCYAFNFIVHPRQARICSRFAPRGGKSGRR